MKNPRSELFETFAIQGMSIRDYFAAKAMQADISNYTDSPKFGKDFWTTENIAERAYNMADAMIKERSK